jgi:hypothetical protein
VLQWFNKSPDQLEASINTGSNEPINPERFFLKAGVLELTADETDLQLMSEFRNRWLSTVEMFRSRIHTPSDRIDALTKSLNIEGEIGFKTRKSSTVATTSSEAGRIDTLTVGYWPSRSAVLADCAAASTLSSWSSEWDTLSSAQRITLLLHLRIFYETCPVCTGDVVFKEDVVESCCQSVQVFAGKCEGCNERLFEVDWEEAAEADLVNGS